MLGQMRAGDPNQAPEERFASQLDQLASMGFVDRQANIQGGSETCIGSLHTVKVLSSITRPNFGHSRLAALEFLFRIAMTWKHLFFFCVIILNQLTFKFCF
jgi:hypothetical protein